MSRGNRHLLAAFAGLTALAIAAGTGAYFGSLYGPDHKQYQAIAGDQSGKNDYQGPSQSLQDIAGVPSLVERVIANPQPGSGQDHERRDLAAQGAMAAWAFWMVLAAFLSVLVTTVGTIFLYKQIILTRRAVEDTGLATKAMERQNDLTVSAQRPWIGVDNLGFGSTFEAGATHLGVDGFYASFDGVAVNHGGAPAFGIGMHAEIYLIKTGQNAHGQLLEFCKSVEGRCGPFGDVAFPGAKVTVGHMLFLAKSEIDQALNMLPEGAGHVGAHVHGCVNYMTDHMTGVRQTRFSFPVISVRNGDAYAIDFADPNWPDHNIKIAAPGIWEAK